jgi:hypothetical protein
MSVPKLYVVTNRARDEIEAGDRPLGCGVCGERFRKDQIAAFDRHMAKCGQSPDAERMAMESPRQKWPMFQPGAHGDAEFGEWFLKHRKAILEGRVKP